MLYSIQTFPVGAFQCNCSIIEGDEKSGITVVDPGDEISEITTRLESLKKPLRMIWHTHAHLDHVGATKSLLEWGQRWNQKWDLAAPAVYLHEEDRWLYENISIQSQMLGLPPFQVPAQFQRIKDRQLYEFFPGMTAIHTPGHTPGSACLHVNHPCALEMDSSFLKSSQDSQATFLLSGDTLFRRSIGRTDLWGGDGDQILKSIERKLFGLPASTVVIPGHGPITTIEEEKDLNPFLT